jgi:hypothetical protein|tara:strand:+ start:1700 stop:2155 length:456 start_codon:yes stop_codon:yes gene_type:complete
MKQIRSMRDAGQKEYAHDEQDVFANFNRISNLLDIDRKKVLMTYLLKHIDGIVAYINGHKSQREDVTGRITDCIVYLTLLWGMIKDDTISREESHPSMHGMWDRIEDESGGISITSKHILDNRLSPDGNMPKMHTERTGIEEHSQKVGEPT